MTIQSSCITMMEKMVVVHHHLPAAVCHNSSQQQSQSQSQQQQQPQPQQQQPQMLCYPLIDNKEYEDEDENSLCSTVCVVEAAGPKIRSSNSSEEHERRQRLVSFGGCDEDDEDGFQYCRYYENHLYAQEESAAFWYSTAEYQNFKAAASFMSRMIDKAEGSSQLPRDPLSYIGILENAYHACCLQSQSLEQQQQQQQHYQQPLVLETKTSKEWSFVVRQGEEGVDNPNKNDEEEDDIRVKQSRLKQLFRVEIGLGRLGLERRCVRFVAQDKSRRRNDLIRLIKQHGRQRKNNNNNNNSNNNYNNYCPEELRTQCEAISYASRLFAHRLAEAQAAVCVV